MGGGGRGGGGVDKQKGWTFHKGRKRAQTLTNTQKCRFFFAMHSQVAFYFETGSSS